MPCSCSGMPARRPEPPSQEYFSGRRTLRAGSPSRFRRAPGTCRATTTTCPRTRVTTIRRAPPTVRDAITSSRTPNRSIRSDTDWSYTRFEYSGMETVSGELSATDTLRVNVRVKNTGSRAGSEVVQLYVRDLISSVATPVRQLHAFDKVELNPGEERSVRFSIPVPQLSLYDADMRRIVEPGDFELQVGASSRDIRLRDTVTVAGCTDIPDPKATGVKAGAVREPGAEVEISGTVRNVQAAVMPDVRVYAASGSRTCGRDRQTRKIHPPYPDQRPGRLRTGRLRTPGDRRHGGRQPRHRVGTGHELTQNH